MRMGKAAREGKGGIRNDSSPDSSPSKKRVRRDLEASLRDGFDNPNNSPSRRRKRQEIMRHMGNNVVVGSSRLSPSKGREVAIDFEGESLMNLSQGEGGADVNTVEIESPSRRTPSRPVNRAPSSDITPNLTSEFIESTSNIELYQLIQSHILPGNDKTTMELLTRIPYDSPDDVKHNTVASYLSEAFFDLNMSNHAYEFVKCCLDVLSTILSRPNKHHLEACCMVLSLLDTAFTFDPIRIITECNLNTAIETLVKLIKLGLPAISKISSVPSTKETPWFKTIVISTESSSKASILLCALDVLETLTICCSLDNVAFKTCWSSIGFDFIKEILLSPNQHQLPVNVLIKSLRILLPSVSDSTLSPILNYSAPIPTDSTTDALDSDNSSLAAESKAKIQLEQESLILNTLVRYLFQKFEPSLVLLFTGLDNDITLLKSPISPTYIQSFFQRKDLDIGRKNDHDINYELYLLNDQQTTMLHQTVIQFFTSVVLRRGADLIVDKCPLIHNLAQVISHQLDAVYESPQESRDIGRVQFINDSVRLFHAIWILSHDTSQLTRSLYGDSGYENMVAMARIALSEYPDPANPSIAVRFDSDVIDRSRDILEQCITLAEADEIYLSMYAT